MNDTQQIVHLTSQAMELVLYLSLPAIAAATIVGLIIGLLQALTSIQEQTLPHGFKLVAIIFALAATVRWLGPELMTFTNNLFEQIPLIRYR
ncbi:MAG TPA: type III secretion system export apparatus subunit SctS [Candidatus Thiothrix moscowensis]|uniref:type III secretion system export apparatus subunit SctS n=1 Tax=unclassified Thiothrix TaxID=2636184 RepID=UPI001A1FBCE4|nr:MULTISPECIES: type III secretion system export apparatus subunit SctS [unclassified Thiothrix]MBJ6611014.1 type III secretion system export apparatus subunit SctS [Candidatus Thiothrix moscowensis]HRJ54053.1 type III secretion system export apparatus subunit SctS [Candidatus Thiothrix moscowensis]HRJ94199.1 type III secretion system export apparatus subunit SctS [Candidatus Thiothrix moscowensis]